MTTPYEDEFLRQKRVKEEAAKLKAEAEAKAEAEKGTIWQQIADRLNAQLNRMYEDDVITYADMEVGDEETVDVPKRGAGDYKDFDTKQLFKEFKIDIINLYNITFDADEDPEAPRLTFVNQIQDVFINFLAGDENVENERDITSDVFQDLTPLQKLAWTRLINLEIEAKAFPTHVLKGEKITVIINEMYQAGWISTRNISDLGVPFMTELHQKLPYIINAAGESPGGGLNRSVARIVKNTKAGDIMQGNSLLPTIKTASQVFIEERDKEIILDLLTAKTQKQFNAGIDRYLIAKGYYVPSAKPGTPSENIYKTALDIEKIDMFYSMNARLEQGQNPNEVADLVLAGMIDFLNSDNLELAQIEIQENLFLSKAMNEADAKKELNAQLFRLGFKKESFTSEDYDDLLQQMRTFSSMKKFGEFLGLQIPTLLTRKTNDSLIKDSSLLRSQLLDLLNPQTESYRRYLINNVLTDEFVKLFQETINTRKSVSLEKLFDEKLRDFTDNPNDSDFGSLITPLSADDFDEQKVIERIGTLQQQINLGYDPETNTWDTRAGLLPKSPLSALEVGPMVSDEDIISAYEELAGDDERFYRYLQGLTPTLKSQFVSEYKAARFDEPELSQAERDMFDKYNQIGFKEEDLAGADLDVYKSLRNKLSQSYGARASNIFNQLNPDPTQVDSETARQQIQAVGIPTPDPVKILQGLETQGIALTEGQKKVLLASGTPGITVTQGTREAEDMSAYVTKPDLSFKDFLKGKRSDLQRQLTLDYGRTPPRQVSGGSRTFTTRFTRGRT